MRGLAVGANDDDHIAVGVADPNFAMFRAEIDVRLFDDFGAEGARAVDGVVEVVDLEPEEDTVPVLRCLRSDEVRMVLLVPSVQLENQLTVGKNAIVDVPVRIAAQPLGAEQRRVPLR